MRKHIRLNRMVLIALAVVVALPVTALASRDLKKSLAKEAAKAYQRHVKDKAKNEKRWIEEYQQDEIVSFYYPDKYNCPKTYEEYRALKITENRDKWKEQRKTNGFFRKTGNFLFGPMVPLKVVDTTNRPEIPEKITSLINRIDELPSTLIYNEIQKQPEEIRIEILKKLPKEVYDKLTYNGRRPILKGYIGVAPLIIPVHIDNMSSDLISYHFIKTFGVTGLSELDPSSRREALKKIYGEIISDDILFDDIADGSDDYINEIYDELKKELEYQNESLPVNDIQSKRQSLIEYFSIDYNTQSSDVAKKIITDVGKAIEESRELMEGQDRGFVPVPQTPLGF